MATMKTMIALALAAFGVVGCGDDYDRTEFRDIKTPLGGGINRSRLEVPLGMIVTAHIAARDDDDETLDVHIASANTSIVEVAPTQNDRTYSFLGVGRGTTEISIKAEGKTVLILRAIVEDQPSLQ
jgi:hypothetical protein